jgi:hypothetical protein
MLVGAALAAAAIVGAAGCGGGSTAVQTGTGRVGILLTDQAGEFEHVFVTVMGVEIHTPGGGWVTVATQSDINGFITQPVDLLSLRNLEKLVGMGTIPAGFYTQLRLLLSPQAEVVVGGQHEPLEIPSGSQTGLKALNFTVPASGVVYLLIDIKADRITHADGKYVLPPTAISVTVFTGPFGALHGTVSLSNSAAVATAFFAGTSVPVAQTTINATDGSYTIPDLLAGDYYLEVAATGFEPFDSRPTTFAVTAGATTEVPLITLTPVPPTP